MQTSVNLALPRRASQVSIKAGSTDKQSQVKGSSMKARLFLSIALCLGVSVAISIKSSQSTYSQTKKNTPTLSQDEQALLNEINQARAHPQVYASYLEK